MRRPAPARPRLRVLAALLLSMAMPAASLAQGKPSSGFGAVFDPAPQAAPPTPAAVPPAAAPAIPRPFSVTEQGGLLVAEGVRFALGPASYLIPRAEIRGSALSRDDVARLLDPASGVPAAERIARLSASEIVIPELVSEVETPGGKQLSRYRDIRMSAISGGRVASAASGSGTFETPGRSDGARGSFARVELSDMDVGLAVALFDETGSPDSEMARIYGAFAIEGLESREPNGAGTRIARLAGQDFRGRRTREGWAETLSRFSGTTDLGTATPEVRGRAVAGIVDLLQSFEIGSLEATGIEFEESKDKASTGRIARIGYTGGGGRPGEFRIDGFEAGGRDGRVRMASFSLGGLGLSSTLEAAKEVAGLQPDEMNPAQLRRLVPTIGSFRIGGLEIDLPKGSGPAAAAPGKVAIGSVELLAGSPIEGIPSDLRIGIRDVAVPVDPKAEDEGTKRLAELGYRALNASATASLGWNAAGQDLVVREVSIEAREMGRVVLRSVLGNVSRDVFNPDTAVASVALVGATIRSIDLGIENAGLFERILSREAARQKKSVDALRREYGMAAALGIPMMLGNSPAAKSLSQAVGRFVAKPGRLTIQARTTDPAGLGFADVMVSPDPTALLDRIEIEAKAE